MKRTAWLVTLVLCCIGMLAGCSGKNASGDDNITLTYIASQGWIKDDDGRFCEGVVFVLASLWTDKI